MQSLANAYCTRILADYAIDSVNDTLAGGEAALTVVQALYCAEAMCPGAVDNVLNAAFSSRFTESGCALVGLGAANRAKRRDI